MLENKFKNKQKVNKKKLTKFNQMHEFSLKKIKKKL